LPLRAQDSPVRGFRKIGQPRSLIDRIADYRIFIPVFGADIAGENAARRNSDAEIDWQPAQLDAQRARGGQRR